MTMQNEISDALQTDTGKRKAVALIILAVLAVTAAQFVYIFKQPDSDQILSLSQALVEQLPDDHTQAIPVSSYEEVVGLFPEIGFGGLVPERLIGARYELQTARVVKLGNVTLLKLKLLDQQKQPRSLFIQKFIDEFRPLHNRQQLRHEWLVSYWYEGELFYSLVSPQR